MDGACAMAFTPPRSAILGHPLRPARAAVDGGERISGPMERVAVADLGSNSWRLVVSATSRTPPGGASWTRSARRSGSGPAWATSACCSPSASTAPCTRRRCSARSAARPASTPSRRSPPAPSATRPTATELLDAIRERTGLDPRVISGREEARYGWLAIANSTTIDDGFGLDIGGGSIQMHAAGRAGGWSRPSRSPLGSVNVSERFLPGEKAPAKAMKALRKQGRGRARGGSAGGGRRPARRHRRHDPQPRRRRDAARRAAARPTCRGSSSTRDALEELIELLAAQARLQARRRERHQARPRRRDPGRCAGARRRARQRRLRLRSR